MSPPFDGAVVPVRYEIVFQGYFRVDRHTVRHALFAGGMSGDITREVFERGHAAAVLPYDPVRDAVVLIEQFRAGAYAAGRPAWLVEIVAGIIEDGESATDVARREAVEEAGLAVTALEPIADVFASPGGSSETVALFCGRCDTRTAGGIHGVTGEGEDIRVIVRSFSTILDELRDGAIRSAPALIALQWLALNRDRLRARWTE